MGYPRGIGALIGGDSDNLSFVYTGTWTSIVGLRRAHTLTPFCGLSGSCISLDGYYTQFWSEIYFIVFHRKLFCITSRHSHLSGTYCPVDAGDRYSIFRASLTLIPITGACQFRVGADQSGYLIKRRTWRQPSRPERRSPNEIKSHFDGNINFPAQIKLTTCQLNNLNKYSRK